MTPALHRLSGLVFALALSGCASLGPHQPSADTSPACPKEAPTLMAEARLYFGRGISGGGEVSADDWQTFLDTTVTPRFPDGFTVLDGSGQWLSDRHDRVISENSKVLVVLVGKSDEARAKLKEVAQAYARRFDQEAVGLSLKPACVGWIAP